MRQRVWLLAAGAGLLLAGCGKPPAAAAVAPPVAVKPAAAPAPVAAPPVAAKPPPPAAAPFTDPEVARRVKVILGLEENANFREALREARALKNDLKTYLILLLEQVIMLL